MRARRLLGLVVPAAVAVALVMPAAPAGAAVRLEAELSGANEVPDPGDPDGSGVARVRVNVKTQRVCYVISVTDISLPATGAHIHRGVAGVAGPIKVALNNPTEVGSSGVGLAFGCEQGVSKTLLRRIQKNPQRFYVNVHTTEYPAGAVRGQLS
jgi:hypothetical protein